MLEFRSRERADAAEDNFGDGHGSDGVGNEYTRPLARVNFCILFSSTVHILYPVAHPVTFYS